MESFFLGLVTALRLLISDVLWSRFETVVQELKYAAGSPSVLSERMFIEAVLYQACTGTPWRDLPEEFGHWNGVWKQLRERLQSIGDEQLSEPVIDSTIVRAYQHVAGVSKKAPDKRPRARAALGVDDPPSGTRPARTGAPRCCSY